MNRGQIARGEFRAGNWQDRKARRQGCLGATVFPVTTAVGGGGAHITQPILRVWEGGVREEVRGSARVQ
jgi:hypothetical protein